MFWSALSICLTWLVAGLVCIGIGLALQRLSQPVLISTESIFLAFWLGWGVSIGLLQAWHLTFPVNGWASLLLASLGVAGLLWNRRACYDWLRNRSKSSVVYLVGLALITVWIASLGLDPIRNYDTGLYHLSTVRWNATYAIVPGLANLHSRLGYNSSFFLYPALFEIGSWQGKAYHFANGLLCLVFSAYVWWAAYRALVARRPIPLHHLLAICLAIPLAYYQVSYTSNLSNDLAVFLIGALVAIYLCRLLFAEFEGLPLPDMALLLGTILFLSAIGTTIKLSFLPLGATTCMVGLLVSWQDRRLRSRVYDRQALAWFAGLAFFVLALWGLRGILLSGYVAYPSPTLSMDLPWRVPKDMVIQEANWIASWARWPERPPVEVLGDWRWLLIWVRRHALDFRILFPAVVFASGVVLLLMRPIRGSRSCTIALSYSRVAELLLPGMVALLVWFLSAPEVRFAGVAFWWLAAGALALGSYHQGLVRPVLVVACLAILVWCAPYIARRTLLPRGDFVRSFDPAPVAQTVVFTTDSGLKINIPAQSDQCWDAPLPCTPQQMPALRLLREGDLSAGFTLLPVATER